MSAPDAADKGFALLTICLGSACCKRSMICPPHLLKDSWSVVRLLDGTAPPPALDMVPKQCLKLSSVHITVPLGSAEHRHRPVILDNDTYASRPCRCCPGLMPDIRVTARAKGKIVRSCTCSTRDPGGGMQAAAVAAGHFQAQCHLTRTLSAYCVLTATGRPDQSALLLRFFFAQSPTVDSPGASQPGVSSCSGCGPCQWLSSL